MSTNNASGFAAVPGGYYNRMTVSSLTVGLSAASATDSRLGTSDLGLQT